MNQRSSTIFQKRFRPEPAFAPVRTSASISGTPRSVRRWVGAAMLLFGVSALGGCATSAVSSHNACVRGVDLFHQGNYDQAAARFQEALRQEPDNPDALYDMGAVYHQLWLAGGNPGDAAQAEQYYRETLKRNPNMEEAYRAVAVLMVTQGRQDEAVNTLKSWAIRNQNQVAPQLELARLCEELGDSKSAMRYLEDARSIDQENPRAFAAIARLREKAGEPAAAMHYYTLAAERSDSPELHHYIATLRNSTQNGPGAAPPYADGNMMLAQNGYGAGYAGYEGGYTAGYGANPAAGSGANPNPNPNGSGSANGGPFSRLSRLFSPPSGTPENRSARTPAFFTQPVPGYAQQPGTIPPGYPASGGYYDPTAMPPGSVPYTDPAMGGYPMGTAPTPNGYPAGYPVDYPNGAY